MKNFVITIACVLLVTYTCFGQDVDPMVQKQAQLMEKISYGYGTMLFKEEKMHFKTGAKYTAPWDNFTPRNGNALKTTIDTLSRHAKLKTETGEFSGSNVIFTSRFPVNMDNDANEVFRIALKENNLTDSLNQKITVSSDPSVSYGSEFSSGFANDKSYSYNWKTISASFSSKSPIAGSHPKGSIVFTGEFVSRYDFIKITPRDIGKEFTLNGQTLKVVDIIKNKLVLSIENGAKVSTDYKFVNLNDANQQIVPLSLMEMNELQKKDKSISVMSAGTSQSKISKKVYDVFKQNPKITEEEFSKATHDWFISLLTSKEDATGKQRSMGPEYLIIQTAGPVQNLFLYTPVYQLKQEFTVKP